VNMREHDPELLAWIVFRRVHGGGVVKAGDCWLDHGQPMPRYLPIALDDFTRSGLVALGASDPLTEATQRAVLTEAGQLRYAALLPRYGGCNARAVREAPRARCRRHGG
jgi:hypothetical protein